MITTKMHGKYMNGITVQGNVNLIDGIINGVEKIVMGEWSFELDDNGELVIKNDDIVRLRLTTIDSVLSNIKYERYFMIQPVVIDDVIGMFVSATGSIYNMDISQSPSKEQALPTIELSKRDEDPSIVGIIAGFENESSEFRLKD